ncbi:contact-dependent growth inhibition system immunity protein [Streptomyces sp. NPDC058676]|uniref:contact-dependent growth inhibition system immunity protein n=1 Tax=unclassified Streptomyces TaxID=2593676 RepID=UPI0036690FB4
MQRFTEFDFGVSWVMGFFHQDWSYEGDTAAEVVAHHFPKEADEEVLAVRRDARTLVDHLPSETLEVLWTAGAEYLPSFERITGSEWTRTVIALCDARLSAKADVRPLTGADTEDGSAHRDAVVAEIGQASFLDAEVREALVECAHRCTPDLAFRVLLRATTNARGAALSPDQYKRMETIGSALHYGEYVVDGVRYLVEEP